MADNESALRSPWASEAQVQQEIAHEQAYIDVVYQRLDESAAAAQALAHEGRGRASLGHEGGLVERDAMVYQASRRISALNAAHEGLVFGRLDLVDGVAHYIGRIGIRDVDREVLLIDWRAPAASLFYRATAQDPEGVVRRRVLRSTGVRVTGLEDDLLDADNAPEDMVIVGEGALLASLSRARETTMHSIVATIQKEQDEAIRAPSRGATSIAGGPGTGKTVVALHRAAYLLYTDRHRFEHGGVLVVGPSSVFMSYIDRVLPSLGETSVTLRALGEVVDGVEASRHDEASAAAVKGSARMSTVLSRVARAPQPGEPDGFDYFYKDEALHLGERDLSAVRRGLLAGGQTRNRAVAKAQTALVDALWSKVDGERAQEYGRDAFAADLAGDDRFLAFATAWWPPLDAVEVWRSLHDRDRLTTHAGDLLDGSEIDAVLASFARSEEPAVEDVPLIDELRYLLGEVPEEMVEDPDDPWDVKQLMSFEHTDREEARQRATESIEDDRYAHVLADESQDLSPMQWRMLGRRGRYASWTIVGDDAQSSWPYPEEAAQARKAALADLPEHSFRLSTNYRNSAEVYDLAAEVARYAVADPDLPEAVRRTGVQPEHRLVADTESSYDALYDAVGEIARKVEGTVAVVLPGGLAAPARGRLAALVGEYGGRVQLLEALDTKGLEFDGVVVHEPDAIVGESPSGWRTLYVVLSRATQLLLTVGTSEEWLRRVRA